MSSPFIVGVHEISQLSEAQVEEKEVEEESVVWRTGSCEGGRESERERERAREGVSCVSFVFFVVGLFGWFGL